MAAVSMEKFHYSVIVFGVVVWMEIMGLRLPMDISAHNYRLIDITNSIIQGGQNHRKRG